MKIFAFAVAAILFAGVSSAQTSQTLIFSSFKPSDQIILSDVARRAMSKKPEDGPKCPGERCNSVSDNLQPPMYVLSLSRPMEIMRVGEGPGLVLPFEWFQK